MHIRALTICFVFAATFGTMLAAGPDVQASAGASAINARIGEPSMSADNGVLTIKASPDTAETFHVYGITGQLVKRVDVKAGDSAQHELKRGLYIVKCSRWARKIMMK